MQMLLNADQIDDLVAALADEIIADPLFLESQRSIDNKTQTVPALVGIRSRGELLAQRLAEEISSRKADPRTIDVGALDITLYRDDLASRLAITIPQGTDMNFAIDDRPVILVDDVLATGRSVRAALDAIVDFGRPRLIRLAVLIDRGQREFPISADYVGLHVPHAKTEQKVLVHLKPTDPEDAVYLR